MKLRLLNLLTILSLLLSVAAVALWVRSYRRHDQVGYDFAVRPDETDRVGLVSVNGVIWVGRRWISGPDTIPGARGFHWDAWKSPDPRRLRGATPGWRTFRLRWGNYGSWGQWGAYLPHGFVAVPPAGASALLMVQARRRRRRSCRGLCARCGYDLRATPGRCPECGETPPVRANA